MLLIACDSPVESENKVNEAIFHTIFDQPKGDAYYLYPSNSPLYEVKVIDSFVHIDYMYPSLNYVEGVTQPDHEIGDIMIRLQFNHIPLFWDSEHGAIKVYPNDSSAGVYRAMSVTLGEESTTSVLVCPEISGEIDLVFPNEDTDGVNKVQFGVMDQDQFVPLCEYENSESFEGIFNLTNVESQVEFSPNYPSLATTYRLIK